MPLRSATIRYVSLHASSERKYIRLRDNRESEMTEAQKVRTVIARILGADVVFLFAGEERCCPDAAGAVAAYAEHLFFAFLMAAVRPFLAQIRDDALNDTGKATDVLWCWFREHAGCRGPGEVDDVLALGAREIKRQMMQENFPVDVATELSDEIAGFIGDMLAARGTTT